ncbi:hypothetical protein RHGRI_037505 [Rhododendron griersonianum]|uniref:F-box/LRR-repeat protein 15/At3g58940/PEG3-like LRR domain-containing protein n=1 Tax=Rhododendron griersonianum TaxID=479676 RepID=A0AAV6HS02_9ERIC|nr:hypothetical protein RHGRI_037505 [Rhododendron griersonianum]
MLQAQKFVVAFDYQPHFASNVNSWIRFAAGKGVEELYLVFDSVSDGLDEDVRYELPQVLYTNSSFKRLSFSLCMVIPKGNVVWNSLKKLSIGYVILSDGVIKKILAGSPVLEVLEFELDDPEEDDDGEGEYYHDSEKDESDGEHKDSEEEEHDGEYEDFEEVEPDSEHDEHEEMKLMANTTMNASLVDATLDCDLETFDDDRDGDNEGIQYTLRGLVESLVHVKRLTLGAQAAKVLLAMEAKGLSSRLLKCEYITLHTFINKSDQPGVESMFKSSSNFETLCMEMFSTTNIEVALPHGDRQGGPNHLVSLQGLLDKILAKLHHLLSAEHCPQRVQLNEMLDLLTEIQVGQQRQYETMEHFMSSQQQYIEKLDHTLSEFCQRFGPPPQ